MAENNIRITPNMNTKDMLIAMCDGNPGALTCMMQLLQVNPITGILDIMLLDELGIYGSKIYMLWNDCCGRDMDKFKNTIQAFRDGKFSEKEIHENLSQVRATPFI